MQRFTYAVRNHYRLDNAGALQQALLDLSGFNSLSIDLNLTVFTPKTVNTAIIQQPGIIASFVHHTAGNKRIRDKNRRT